MEVVNLNNGRDVLTIEKGEPFMHLELLRRDGPPRPYRGRYMFQFMTDEEVEMYLGILEREFSDIMEIDALRESVKDRIVNVEEI